jgi:hypothetical protein
MLFRGTDFKTAQRLSRVSVYPLPEAVFLCGGDHLAKNRRTFSLARWPSRALQTQSRNENRDLAIEGWLGRQAAIVRETME